MNDGERLHLLLRARALAVMADVGGLPGAPLPASVRETADGLNVSVVVDRTPSEGVEAGATHHRPEELVAMLPDCWLCPDEQLVVAALLSIPGRQRRTMAPLLDLIEQDQAGIPSGVLKRMLARLTAAGVVTNTRNASPAGYQVSKKFLAHLGNLASGLYGSIPVRV